MSNSFCITGGNFVNKGAEAMVATIAASLRDGLNDATIYMSISREYVAMARCYGIVPMLSSSIPLYKDLRKMVQCKSIDAVIDVGGYVYGDHCPAFVARRNMRDVKRWNRLKVPVFYMPQAWGPFSSEYIKKATELAVETATICYARDDISFELLTQLCPQKKNKIFLANDVAWNFKCSPAGTEEKYITKIMLESASVMNVCITPNIRVYEKTGGSGPDNLYVKSLISIIVHLFEKYQARCFLLGHEFRREGRDDRYLCRLIKEQLKGRYDIPHIDQEISAMAIKYIIGKADILIASRFHALIAGLSQGVPCLALGWSHKYHELMKSVKSEKYVIPFNKSDCNKHIGLMHQCVGDLIENRDEVKSNIAIAVDEIRNDSARAISRVINYIKTL